MLPDTAPAEVGWGGGHGCEPQAPRSARNKGRCRPAPHSLFGQPPGTHPMPAGQALSWTGVASLTRALPSQECHSPGKGRQHTSRDAARLQIIRAGFPEEGSFGLKPTLATRMRRPGTGSWERIPGRGTARAGAQSTESSQEGAPRRAGVCRPGLGAAWWSEHPVRPEVPIRPEKLAVWVLTQNLNFLKNSHNQLYFS